jgi:hypothetical protein
MAASDGFKRHGEHSYLIQFDESEKDVLINLCEQIIELLAERVDHGQEDPLAAMVGITSHDSPPDDDVLRRLLPDAYKDSSDAAEFRRYTESTLRGKKEAHAISIRMALKSSPEGDVELDHASANIWLGGLNDIRLALGVRLKIEDSNFDHLEILTPDDPLRGVYAVYSWLGWLQESLLEALLSEVE